MLATVLADVDQLIEAGILENVPDDWEFVVTEEVAPGIEIGYSQPRSGACPYQVHRPHDWEAGGGRRVCGICHPRVVPTKGQGR